MKARIKRLYQNLESNQLDGLLISQPSNISYLLNFTSHDSYLIASPGGNFYFTDSRYTEMAQKELKGSALLKKINGSVFKLIAETCISSKFSRLGFEERNLPFAEYRKIRGYLGKKCALVPMHSLVEELRQIKEAAEIKNIREALKIHALAIKYIEMLLKPGRKELEIAAEIEHFIRYHGATGSAFETIVASGPNSSQPHHIPSERKLLKNEPVLIDMGVNYLGYKTDLTRVFFLGKISILCRKVYDIVREAQAKAIAKIEPGRKISSIDAAARNHISRNGFGDCFGHNLGHGIGLEVHEEPHISAKAEVPLLSGTVFTVEPAIYLPGKFGIRIEDMVLVTRKGCEVLSGAINK
ncbi:MAG TPA: Xaa-Pro peptidase family protein [Candidatus Margulisiibacteriota bacterium]|nr:Xaa-Pro peptidase family protein [Candidatus Margulisiibacteriota bacterium]